MTRSKSVDGQVPRLLLLRLRKVGLQQDGTSLLAEGGVDDGVDVAGDLHCMGQERTGFTTGYARRG